MLEKELLEWIYSKNPYNYADISDFVKNVRPKTTKDDLVSGLKVLLNKKIIVPKNDGDAVIDVDDLNMLGKKMISLDETGRRDVENWRFHEDAKRMASNANRWAFFAAAFAGLAVITTFLTRPEKLSPKLKQLDTTVQS